MISIIKSLNNILTKGELILHIEPVNTAIKSIKIINYKLYILTKDEENPRLILTFSRPLIPKESIEDLDEYATQEILKFILHGKLKGYE